MIDSELFYPGSPFTYPPFKNGLYLEEYFLTKTINDKTQYSRKYIPALWTNFQLYSWFKSKKKEMQDILNKWVQNNPSPDGYFTIVQYDDGPLLDLPENTIVYGACSGDEILPLVYQDVTHKLSKIPKKSFKNKSILCSFVGSNTNNDNVLPNVREEMIKKFEKNPNFTISVTKQHTINVQVVSQYNFINTTVNSKFALAPRGYGRSSFRFFEIFQLGSIPDKEWLPFKDKIDYSKICISLNINDIDKLENILLNITEEQYNTMYEEYNKIKHFFTVEGIYNYIKNKYKTN